MSKFNKKLQKPSCVIYRVVEGDVIILNTKNGLYYVLDKVGAMIWQWLLAGKSKDEVIELINKQYEVAKKEKVKDDVEELIRDILKEGLIEAIHA